MDNDGRGERVVENVRRQASAVAENMGQRMDDLRGYAEDAGTTVREYAREKSRREIEDEGARRGPTGSGEVIATWA